MAFRELVRILIVDGFLFQLMPSNRKAQENKTNSRFVSQGPWESDPKSASNAPVSQVDVSH